jgi:hypothetical protein
MFFDTCFLCDFPHFQSLLYKKYTGDPNICGGLTLKPFIGYFMYHKV